MSERIYVVQSRSVPLEIGQCHRPPTITIYMWQQRARFVLHELSHRREFQFKRSRRNDVETRGTGGHRFSILDFRREKRE